MMSVRDKRLKVWVTRDLILVPLRACNSVEVSADPEEDAEPSVPGVVTFGPGKMVRVEMETERSSCAYVDDRARVSMPDSFARKLLNLIGRDRARRLLR